MDTITLTEFNKIINEEIVNYNEIKMLYEEKKNILISHKMDDLLNIDLEISQKLKSIKKVSDKRKYMSRRVGEDITMTALIEKSKKVNKDLSTKFAAQKEQLKKLAEEIKILEETNLELTKQGLGITSKILNFILESCSSNSSEYNAFGKSKQNIDLSSIVENV